MRSGRPVLAILLAAGAAAGGAAQDVSSANGLTDAIRSLYAEMFRDRVPTQTAQALQRQARQAVSGTDRDGGGVSLSDVEIARDLARASVSADRVRAYFANDLNRDGVLTLEEYKVSLRVGDVFSHHYQSERARAENRPPPAAIVEDRTLDSGPLVQSFNAIDTDRDGRVTLQDVFEHDPPAAYVPAHTVVEAERYLILDGDGDGNVTMAEVDSTSAAFLAEQALAGVGPRAAAGKDGDESPDLVDAVRCRMPPPSAAARIVRLGVRDGDQLSAVALGGQDERTYSIGVEIEPGAEPLYIVATSGYPAIWRLTGATRRVEAFVGSTSARDARSMWPAVGVTGLARDRFHAVPNACFGSFDGDIGGSPEMAAAASRLAERRLGRPIDVAFGAYQAAGVRLPSAEPFEMPVEVPDIFRAPRSEAAAREWREFLVHFPAGLSSPSPRQIVSRAVPEPYQVYPHEAGLAQLLELGALAPIAGVSDFEIRRQIRFPAALYGAHSAVFRLPDGVPPPTGNPANSRVMSATDPRLCLIGCR